MKCKHFAMGRYDLYEISKRLNDRKCQFAFLKQPTNFWITDLAAALRHCFGCNDRLCCKTVNNVLSGSELHPPKCCQYWLQKWSKASTVFSVAKSWNIDKDSSNEQNAIDDEVPELNVCEKKNTGAAGQMYCKYTQSKFIAPNAVLRFQWINVLSWNDFAQSIIPFRFDISKSLRNKCIALAFTSLKFTVNEVIADL